MALPDPTPGLLIRYSYLWSHEFASGLADGRKYRPAAIILSIAHEDGRHRVTVLPVTHTPPSDPTLAVEIPAQTKRRLGLDDARSWIVLTEANRFLWPGPDVRPTGPGRSIAYGPLPYRLFEEVRTRFLALARARKARAVPRSE